MIPLSRLRSRLGLNPYNKSAPVTEDEVKAKKLKIALSQHIGAPAIPIVNKGDTVTKGQLIAKAADNALSVSIHASMDGTITDINKKYITVSVKGGTE